MGTNCNWCFMKKDTIIKLTNTFEELLHFTENGVEFWFARDLQHLLGYEKWDNFQNVINKAKVAYKISGYEDSDHFADVGKMVSIGSRAQKEIFPQLKGGVNISYSVFIGNEAINFSPSVVVMNV